MKLSGKQRRFLRSLGHHLDAVVQIGKEGIGEPQVEAIRQALLDHELIKVRLLKYAPLELGEVIFQVEENTPGVCVQKLGKTLLFYAPHPEKPSLVLPKGKAGTDEGDDEDEEAEESEE